MGVTLAFVCEALERGWLKASDVGVPFGWGDWRGMLRLVEMTARREGFGDRLAEGAWRLAESVHPEGTRLVYAVKRLELPAHSAPVRADLRPPVDGRQAGVRRAQPALHGGRRLARALPLHLRARLRPLRRRAVRAHGPRGDRLGRRRRGAGARRGADRQPRAALQRARGRPPRARRP